MESSAVDTAAAAREEWLGGKPGWLLVWTAVGLERTRVPGASGTRCACKRGVGCPSPGKHPWTGAGATVGGPTDQVVPLTLAEARSASWPGVRLAAWLAIGERVLDADSDVGLGALWRAWPEIERSWLLVRTRRGMHAWQRAETRYTHSPDNGNGGIWDGTVVRFVGGDIKTRGVVVWPDDRNRWVLSRDEARDWLTRLHYAPAGDGRIEGRKGNRDGVKIDGFDRLNDDVARTLLYGACDWLVGVPEGARNDALNWAGWTAGRRALDAGCNPEEVWSVLRGAARQCGLEEGEITATLRSSLYGGSDVWTR